MRNILPIYLIWKPKKWLITARAIPIWFPHPSPLLSYSITFPWNTCLILNQRSNWKYQTRFIFSYCGGVSLPPDHNMLSCDTNFTQWSLYLMSKGPSNLTVTTFSVSPALRQLPTNILGRTRLMTLNPCHQFAFTIISLTLLRFMHTLNFTCKQPVTSGWLLSHKYR